MTASRLGVALALVLTGLAGTAAGAGRAGGPVLIGALTEAWGPTPAIIGLRDGLVVLGYRENEDFAIGVRFTQGTADPKLLQDAARQLVERGAQVIVTGGGSLAPQAARTATRQVPIVFMGGSDPVGTGLVESFRRPGGNVTGIADLDVDLAPKRLQIFQELAPGMQRVLLPYDASSPGAAAQLEAHREAARRLGVTLVERPLRTQNQARDAMGAVRKGQVDGIFAPRTVSLNLPAFVLEAAAREGIPAMFHDAVWVERGGLASYSANIHEVGRQAARLVDRIIRGARPADIPVERATSFQLVINAATARSLDLAIPPPVLVRASRVIE